MTFDLDNAPEPPWHRVPGVEPWWSGWRQGDGWYVYTFLPFWKSLNADEQAVYLQRWPPATAAWAEYLADYVTRPPPPPRTFEKDPRPPWQQYPARGPRWFGWRFGRARSWLREEFLPFWCYLSPNDRQQYQCLWPTPSPDWDERLAEWEADMYRG